MATPANLALEGKDPRDVNYPNEHAIVTTGIIDNPYVSFEEYAYYASITRAEEKIAHEEETRLAGPKTLKGMLKNRFRSGDNHVATPPVNDANEKYPGEKEGLPSNGTAMMVSEAEWKAASRSIRTAGWSGIFYLITTDILGPFSAPWSFAQMGYGPGVALYTVFGGFASYSGYILWKIFIHMDSDRYPLIGYGDLFYRVYGNWARHTVNVFQAVQLLLTVSILILSNGQAISQVSQASICFIVCLVIFMVAGMILGQIRTLQRFSWIANFAVWVNLLIIFIVMGVAANSPPNFAAAESSFGSNFAEGPILTFAGTPPDGFASGGSGFIGSLNGLNQAVYSYGGAMLFVAFMAEMRHPWDFWKGMICAQAFIYVVYMFFGIFVYSYFGQFTYNPIMQGLSPYNWQTATNIMNLVTGLIAAALYGNIGIKVTYTQIFQSILGAPALTTRSGKLIWVILVPVYWALAFIICASVPQFSFVSGLVGAICILSFTYTFPAILSLGWQIKKDAMTAEEQFDPATGTYNYIDSGFTRFFRGFKVRWWLNIFNTIYFLGALVTCGLGTYSSVEGLIGAFGGNSVATSFGCTAPN